MCYCFSLLGYNNEQNGQNTCLVEFIMWLLETDSKHLYCILKVGAMEKKVEASKRDQDE